MLGGVSRFGVLLAFFGVDGGDGDIMVGQTWTNVMERWRMARQKKQLLRVG